MPAKRNIYLSFRDGINKITGKQKLIDEYTRITAAIARSADDMGDIPERKELLKKFYAMQDSSATKENGAIATKSFNPYLVRTSKASLKEKIAIGRKIMEQYNIR